MSLDNSSRGARRDVRQDTRCLANRSTARETAAPGSGCSRRRSRTCAGLGPALAVSRLSRATRRSHGSLTQHVSRRTSISQQTPTPQGASERRDCERRDTLQKIKPARSVTAAVTELRGSPKRCGEPVFPRRRTRGPQRACALGWESERRVRMRPCGDGAPTSGRREITDVKLTRYCFR